MEERYDIRAKFEKKKELSFSWLPYIAPDLPNDFKRFVVFIGVEGEDVLYAGTGTLIEPNLILTCHHLFEGIEAIKEIFITFFINKQGQYATVRVENYEATPLDDIAFLRADLVAFDFLKPAPILSGRPINPQEIKTLTGAGCPAGILGKTWKPTLLGFSGKFFVTKGLLIPGISGGGIFIKRNNWWNVFGVHSFGYFDSKTLYSVSIARR